MDFTSTFKQLNSDRQTDEAGGAIARAATIDPDQYAKDLALSKQTQAPLDMVSENRSEFEQKAKEISPAAIAKVLKDTPEATQFWKDHAPLVSDDFSIAGRWKKNWNDLPESFLDSSDTQRLIELNHQEMFGTVTPAEKIESSVLDKSLENNQRGTGGFISQGVQGTAQNSVQLGRTIGAGGIGGIIGAIGGGIIGGVGGLLAGPEGIIPSAIQGARIGAKFIAPAAMAYENFNQQSALTYNDIKQIQDEKGNFIDPDIARGAAIAVGAVNAGLDLIGLEKMAKTIPRFEKIQGAFTREGIKKAIQVPGMKEAFLRIGKKYATGIAAEGITEGAQQATQIIGEEVSKSIQGGEFKGKDIGQMWDEIKANAEGGAAVATVIGLPGSSYSAARATRLRGVTPEQTHAYVSGINQAVREEKLFQRSPEAFKSLMDSLTGDEKFYIDGKAALDAVTSMEPSQRDALFNAVPELKTELETAAAGEADVSMKKSDYATYIAPYSQADQLAPHIKLDPADMSMAQRADLQEFITQNPELAQSLQSATPPNIDVDTLKALERQVNIAMKSAGRSTTEAKAIAPLFARKLARDAAAFGLNPLQQFNENFLGFQTVDANGQPIQQSSNIDTLLNDLTNVDAVRQDGKFILDEATRDAVKSFSQKLAAAGISPEQAKQMGGRAVFDQLYPAQTMNVGDQEVTLPQVDLTPGENGQLNLSITPPDEHRATIANYLNKDEAASHEHTPEFKTWFGNSKVTDKNGNPQVVFRGGKGENINTKGGNGKSFNTGAFFSLDPKNASTYAPNAEGANVTPVFLSLQNPVVVDAGGKNWSQLSTDTKVSLPEITVSSQEDADLLKELGVSDNNVPVKNKINARETTIGDITGKIDGDSTTDQITRWARQQGYDGVIFKNVLDRGPHLRGGESVDPSDVYVAFNPEQIKSAITLETYNQQGERGFISFLKGEVGDKLKRVIVSFTKNANLSTGAHEFAHFAVALHRKYAEMAWQEILKGGNTNPELVRIKNDWEALKTSVGAESDTLTNEQEEKIARMFEGYLREGSPPSEALRGIFTRFREWFTALYRDAKESGIDFSPEVAGIFDRWLASEDEISHVKNKNSALSEIASSLNLEADVAVRLQQYIAEAQAQAEEKLYREMTREQRRQESKAYDEEFTKERVKVYNELRQKREYNLLNYLRENGLKILAGPESEGLPPELLSQTESDTTVHPDVVADLYGYDSGQEMLRALKNTPELEGAVNRETRARLREKYPNMIEDGRIHSEALSAIMNDKTLLAIDLLVKEMGKAKGGINRSGMKLFAKAMAQQQVKKMLAKDSGQGFRFEVAREKALREALKLSRKGDVNGALKQLQNAMINQMIFKQLSEFQSVKEKAEKLFDKVNQKDKELAGRNDLDFLGAARFILYKYGLGGEDFDVQTWLSDLENNDPMIKQDLAAAIDAIEAPRKPAKELTVSEYTQIYNAIKNIYHGARSLKEFEREEKKFRTEQIVSEMIGSMAKHKQIELQSNTQLTGLNKFRRGLLSIRSALRRVELWVEAIDGGNTGPFKNNLWRPIARAENTYIAERRKWLGGYRDILTKYKDLLNKPGKIESGMTRTDALGRQTPLIFNDKMELVGFLLHTGNASNLDKLLGGYGIPLAQFRDATAKMIKDGKITKQDMQLVQELWDYVESLKPLAQKAHKSLYGYRFDEIENSPITLEFPGEKPSVFRGGYWPAIADADQVNDAKEIDQIIDDTRRYMLATVNKGMLKSRVEKYRAPLKTDLRLGSQHVDKMLRFIHLEPAARDAARLINNKDFREHLAAIDPEAYSGMLIPWLQRFASQSTEPNNVAGDRSSQLGRKLLNVTRSAAMRQLILYNPVVALQNIANMAVSAHVVGYPRLASAFAKVTSNPGTVKQVENASKMMQERNTIGMLKISQEINQIAGRKTKFANTRDFMVRHGGILLHSLDIYLSTVTWVAAYDKAIAEDKNDATAIEEADSAVRKSQGARGAKDVAKIEAAHPAVQFLMPFYGYFNSQLNLQQTEFGNIMRKHGWQGTPKMLMAYLSLILGPALIGQFITDGLRNKLPDDGGDDDSSIEDWLAWALGAQVKYLAAEVPIAGQGANAAVGAFTKNPMDDRVSVSPAVSLMETAVRAGKNIARAADGNDVRDSRMIQDTMMTLGFATGVPLGQFSKPVAYVADVNEGKTRPKHPLDYIKGIVAGPPPKK